MPGILADECPTLARISFSGVIPLARHAATTAPADVPTQRSKSLTSKSGPIAFIALRTPEVIGGTGYAAAPEDQGRLSPVGRCRARLPTLLRFRGEVDDRTHAWRLSRRGPASREPGCAVIMSFPGG
jgi:hypothetical protein